MNRAEAYAEGFQEGRRWAEADIRDAIRVDPCVAWPSESDLSRANALGSLRGYRDTWARFEAGTLTRQMFEHAPLSPREVALMEVERGN